MEVSDKLMFESLKETCGGKCISDPSNCECFGVMPKEIQKELGIKDYSDSDAFYEKEWCAFYDAQHSHLKKDIESDVSGILEYCKGLSIKVNKSDIEKYLLDGESFREICMKLGTRNFFKKMGLKFKPVQIGDK